MGIFDRLGDVLKSYLNDEDRRIFGPSRDSGAPFSDPDVKAAYEELDELLGHSRDNRNDTGGGRAWESPGSDSGRGARREAGGSSGRRRAAAGPPEELRPDFAELGLPFGASAGECKAAYKKLLNIHHPDRHAGHSGNMKKATEKSARINAAYDRIEKWRGGQGLI
jgi:DnaJ-domain-containing protein 1